MSLGRVSGQQGFSRGGVLVVVLGILGITWCDAALRGQEGEGAPPPGTVEMTPSMLGQVAEGAMEGAAAGGGKTAVGNFLDVFSNFNASGYVETSYTFNFQYSRAGVGGENPVRVLDVRHNEFAFHNFLFVLEKTPTNDSIAGFKVTTALGDDASVANLDPAFFSAGADIDLYDANVAIYVPDDIMALGGTTFRVGKWQTMHGGEVLISPSNRNFSRSLLFGFAIPFTHTGLRVDRTLPAPFDAISLGGAVVNGWDNVNDNNNSLSYMAQAMLVPVDWFSLGFTYMWGPEQTTAPGAHANADGRTLIDLTSILSVPKDMDLGALEGLSVALNLDWAGEEGVAGVGPGGAPAYAEWYGLAGIISYDFALPPISDENDKRFYVAMRGEFFDDVDGTRLGPLSTFLPGRSIGVQVWELTWTLGWRPVENILLRAEVRYDKADDNIFEVDSDNGLPSKNHQVTVALNALFTF